MKHPAPNRCPVCGWQTTVTQSTATTDTIKRYRVCRHCTHKFQTHEITQEMYDTYIKHHDLIVSLFKEVVENGNT